MHKMCSEITLLTLWRFWIIRKRYIHIILDLAWPKYMKSTLEQDYIVSVLHSQLTWTDDSIRIGKRQQAVWIASIEISCSD